MKISKKDVLHIAQLSRLELSEEEEEVFQKQLSSILVYVDKLNESNTERVEPTSHVLKLENVFRDDLLRKSLDRNDALSNAPDRTEKFYKVPKIIE